MLFRSQRIKEEYIEWKKTLKCSRCKNDDYRVLEFHHRNPLEKEFTIANMVDRGYSREKLNDEITKCDVLCANCHRIVHYEIESLHHFEKDGVWIDPLIGYLQDYLNGNDLNVITNHQYELSLNDKKREVFIPNKNYAKQIYDDYTRIIQT